MFSPLPFLISALCLLHSCVVHGATDFSEINSAIEWKTLADVRSPDFSWAENEKPVLFLFTQPWYVQADRRQNKFLLCSCWQCNNIAIENNVYHQQCPLKSGIYVALPEVLVLSEEASQCFATDTPQARFGFTA